MVQSLSIGKPLTRSRQAVLFHARAKRNLEHEGSRQSRLALDWTNFFLADVQTGFGTFAAYYLADLGWAKGDVGVALTIGRVAGALSLIPGGALADFTTSKRTLAAAGMLMIAGAAVILALWPQVIMVIVAETLHGLSGAILGPAIAAISLGLTGRRHMSLRIGRNNRFRGAGTALTALLLGLLGSNVAKSAIFLATAVLTIPALISLRFIRSEEIDYARARNAGSENAKPSLNDILTVFKNTSLLRFAGARSIFQLADSSLLPLASEHAGSMHGAQSSLIVSAMIVALEVVVAILAPWTTYLSELWGRKPLLGGFCAEILRAVLFAFVTNPILLIAIELLDGISGASVTVLSIVIISDLSAGTGRFNFARGAVGLLSMLGASASTTLSGFAAQEFGRLPAFLSMGAMAAAGALLVWFMVPETKPSKYAD